MNEIIENLRSQYDSLKAEEKRLKDEISATQSKRSEIIREYCQYLTEQFSQYLNKKVTIEKRNGYTVTGFFCGFTNKYLDFEAIVDLAKIKKDGSPSASHYPWYDVEEFSENLKITLCDE